MTPQPGGGAGAAGRWGGVDPVVSRTMKGDGGNRLWVGGGNPVVSRCSTTGYRPAPLAGVRFHLVWFPAVSLVPSSTAGYRLSSLRDEVGEGSEPCGEMSKVDGMDGWDGTGGLGFWGGLRAAIRWCRGRGGAMGEWFLGWGRQSGGVARAELNRRLQAIIPAG